MSVMHRRAIWAIGCGQLVNWGVMYFAFGVLLVPLEQFLDEPRWLVAGAFSLSLLVSAFAAPTVGRLADRGQGPAVMQAGGLIASGLLIGWAAWPSLISTYVVWALLGVCGAAILYEPVFAIVGRAFSDPAGRMRAIATVTVMGGLASSVFLPGTAALTERLGWRGATVAIAGLIAVTTLIVWRIAFGPPSPGLRGVNDLEWSTQTIREAILSEADDGSTTSLPHLNRIAAVFAVSAIVNSAVASNMVAALIDGGFAPTLAASIAGLFGVMQLPGRLLMTTPTFTPGPVKLIVVSFAFQIAGLVALMVHSTTALVAGVILFAAGAGLTTLARPYWVLHSFGPDRAGHANGVIARAQQIARAAGPVSAAAAAGVTGYPAVFGALAIFLVMAMSVLRTDPSRR
jgi:MFS family permease